MRFIHKNLMLMPTPIAGLALGIASLGLAWENVLIHTQAPQIGCALLAGSLLLLLTAKFVMHPRLLIEDLRHPVVGSVVPTYTMAMMVICLSVKTISESLAIFIWLVAVGLHGVFLVTFCFYRLKQISLSHLIPSWFVPPVGIIVAAVCCPTSQCQPIALFLFWFGLVCYGVLLPIMLYRLIFSEDIPDPAKPTLAILAAPASLSLAGYLSIITEPSPIIVALLLGIALLMTVLIYFSFVHLLRLPFSPAYAAFTFPMVIGATALYKASQQCVNWGIATHYSHQLTLLANIELAVATAMVFYVSLRYVNFFLLRKPVRTLAV